MLHVLALVTGMGIAQLTPTPIPTAKPLVSASPASTEGLILPAVPELGTDVALPPGSLPGDEIAGVAQAPFVGLALEDAVAMALAKNTDVIVAQENRRIANYRIVAAKGAYDVRFHIEPAYTYEQQAVTNPFFAGPAGAPAQVSSLSAGGGLSGQTLGGAAYSLTAKASRTNDTTSINAFDPTYGTAFSLNLSQPLLRGAGFDDARRALALARVNGDLSTDEALTTASNTLVAVLNAYHDLIAAWRSVAIQEDALRQAKVQSESNARLVKAGAAAPLDVAEADAEVFTFQSNVLSGLQNVARLQNRLKELTLFDPADPIWTANIVPISPPSAVGPEPVLSDVVLAAIKNRPEIAQLRESQRGAGIDIAYATSQLKPQVDLKLGVTENGFAGTPASGAGNPFAASAPLPPAYEQGKLGQAWTNALTGRFPAYSVGATIALPLENRAARGALGAALEEKKRVDVQQVAVIERIEAEARNAIQGYRSARARLVAATAQREAADRVLRGEERKFANGQSTTFLQLQREVSLANARGTELQAQTDLQEALIELDRVSGAIFAHYHVDVSKLGAGLPS